MKAKWRDENKNFEEVRLRGCHVKKGVGGSDSNCFKGYYVQAAMSSEFTQNIAPQNGGSVPPPETTQDAPEPAPITEQEVGEYREQDRFLPVSVAHPSRDRAFDPALTDGPVGKIANVARIMKSSVPGTAKISKEAKECVQECVSEFISFITSEAAEKCLVEKRKTIGGEDILYAMVTLGFDQYAETLKIHLAKLRQVRSTRYQFQHLENLILYHRTRQEQNPENQ